MKENKKLLIIGNFGYRVNNLNGQTIKTRNVYELIKNGLGANAQVNFFDTAEIYFDKLKYLEILKKVCNCELLVFIPALKSFKYLFPVLFVLSIIFRFKIIHIPVGGRHNEFLNRNKLHSFLLSKIFLNAPQTKREVNYLVNSLNFSNTIYFPNFRIHDYVPKISSEKKNLFKICFMARVTPLKGLDVIFRLSDYLKKTKVRNIQIIIYGPIEEGYEEEFKYGVGLYNFVSYGGVLNPNQVFSTLNKCDVLLLPTRYPGEGFPGTVLESYISGIPVIVSNWRHLPEFVKANKTGFLFDLDKEHDLFKYVEILRNNPKKLYEMKLNAYNESKFYSSSFAWSIIKNYL